MPRTRGPTEWNMMMQQAAREHRGEGLANIRAAASAMYRQSPQWCDPAGPTPRRMYGPHGGFVGCGPAYNVGTPTGPRRYKVGTHRYKYPPPYPCDNPLDFPLWPNGAIKGTGAQKGTCVERKRRYAPRTRRTTRRTGLFEM